MPSTRTATPVTQLIGRVEKMPGSRSFRLVGRETAPARTGSRSVRRLELDEVGPSPRDRSSRGEVVTTRPETIRTCAASTPSLSPWWRTGG